MHVARYRKGKMNYLFINSEEIRFQDPYIYITLLFSPFLIFYSGFKENLILSFQFKIHFFYLIIFMYE